MKPYNNKALLKWSALVINSQPGNKDKPYTMTKVTLQELVKQPGYTKFKDRFNWLYKNYNESNYDLVWKELQDYNYHRQEFFIQKETLRRHELAGAYQFKEAIEHYGEIPQWIKDLRPNQHQLLLDRAKLLYEVEPDYETINIYIKDVYTVPELELMDYYLDIPVYHEFKSNEKYAYNTVVGDYKHPSEYLKLVAEQAAIRDAAWIAKNCPEFKVAESLEEILCPEEKEVF